MYSKKENCTKLVLTCEVRLKSYTKYSLRKNLQSVKLARCSAVRTVTLHMVLNSGLLILLF